MRNRTVLKKMALAAFMLLVAAPMLFSASRSVFLTNGFDRSTHSIRWVGTGSNVSLAVVHAIDGLEGEIESEIINRCSNIASEYSGNDIDAFLRGISENMPVIKRDMIRKSRCVADYETENGDRVVWYSLDSSAFESVFDKYISKFKDDSDAVGAYVLKIQGINRLFRNKYDFSEEVQVRVKQ